MITRLISWLSIIVVRTKKSKGITTDELDLSREITVQSDIPELDRIKDKYLWTGKSEAKIPIGQNNVRSIQQLEDKPGVWKYFEVIFNRRIQKGDQIELKYKWPNIPDCKTASPFISTLTDVPTKQIVFRINLGSKYAKQSIYVEERRSIDGDNLLKHYEYALNESGSIELTFSPKRFRYFIVFWKW